MVYRLDAGTVIDAEGNLVIENMYASSVAQQYIFQGSTSGFSAAGGNNTIESFPFASNANSTNVGNTTLARGGASGHTSLTHGYSSGGYAPSQSPTYVNTIDKFPFSISDGTSTDVGDMTVIRDNFAEASSGEHGYGAGGYPSPAYSVIDKFSMATDGNSVDVGDLTSGPTFGKMGQSSTTHGYASGGASGGNQIEKYPFSADENSTDVGDLTVSRRYASGQSSTTHGYVSGGRVPSSPSQYNVIDKFTFAADANATDVGDLLGASNGASEQSSTTHGYASGGNIPPTISTIQRFPFSADANSSSVGDLTQAQANKTGAQV